MAMVPGSRGGICLFELPFAEFAFPSAFFLEIDHLRFCSTLLYPVLILFPAFVRFFRWFWEENAVYVTAAPCT
jgi:hypothetical protein